MSTTPIASLPEPPPTKEAFATFCGAIDQSATHRIMQAIALGTQNGFYRLHLLFQSTGGNVNDGVCLHNYFKTCPVELFVYNVGAVQSAGTIAYLGAKNRIVHKYGVFMVHRTTGPSLGARAERMKSFAKSIEIDDSRTEQILRDFSEITANEWANLRDHEFWFTADDAVKSGFATAIGEFSPPKGSQVYNL